MSCWWLFLIVPVVFSSGFVSGALFFAYYELNNWDSEEVRLREGWKKIIIERKLQNDESWNNEGKSESEYNKLVEGTGRR